MPEYMRIDATTLLNIAVLTTFALLTGSLIASILASGIPFRLRVDGPALGFEPRGIGGNASRHAKVPQTIGAYGVADIEQARLDDDGGSSQLLSPPPDSANGGAGGAGSPPPVQITVESVPYRPAVPYGPVEYFHTPMIPGARETAPLTTFGVTPIVAVDSPTTMDAATIAARQREGGGAPSERRPPRQGSMWTHLTETLRHVLFGG
jgi:hypothetical protein